MLLLCKTISAVCMVFLFFCRLLPEKVKHELNAHRRQQRANVAASGFTPELLGQSPPGPAI